MTPEERVVPILQNMMGKKNFLQGKGLVQRLSKEAGVNILEAKRLLARLAYQGIVVGVTNHGECFGRVFLTIEPPEKEEPQSLIRWLNVLKNSGLSEVDIKALLICHEKLEEFSDSDMCALAEGLVAMRDGQENEKGVPRFVISAKYLLASSKLLDALPATALKAFGLSIECFPGAIPYIVVAGPEKPEAVLLIENPHSFEEAFAAGCAKRIALVVTYGYGLSRNGEAFGNRLIDLVGQSYNRLIPLVRGGNPPSLDNLFAHPRIFYWGDLDKEGLRIYASLQNRIPALKASALYWPMVKAIKTGQSHPYTKATAKEKQSEAITVPNDLKRLAPLCSCRAVDQELIDQSTIVELSCFSIDEKKEDFRNVL